MKEMESRYSEIKNIVFILGIISWVIFMIVPMPAFVIDISIAIMLGFSFVILIKASTTDTWDQFKTFPLIMLMATIFRIALSIATTRKIISGEDPGDVINAAGQLIVRDQIAIGFVMFIILIIVQFVIANGANRFGEVSARFTLDSLPGKQMSIDNDLNQGVIDAETAKRKKSKLQQEVDYYGSLDGAGKYIKGDVWINVVMIVINLSVGFIVGMLQLGLSFSDSISRFTMLSVGDGVVTLLSALMVTVSGAIVMAKVDDVEGEEGEPGESFLSKIFGELTSSSKPFILVGGVLIVLGLVGLPFLPMFLIGSIMILLGIMRNRQAKEHLQERSLRAQETKEAELKEMREVKVTREVDPVIVELGYKLTPLFKDTGKDVFGQKRENFEDKIQVMRQIFANTLGVKLPKIKFRDNVTLNPSTKYEIKIKETTVASGNIEQDHVLAIPSLLTLQEIEGKPTKDPVFGEEAIWITEDKMEEATSSNYNVWSPINIIATHIHDILEKNIWQFVTLQEVSNLVDEVGERHPILKEKMEKIDDLHLLQKVIISLLKERVSIKDLPTIIESFLEAYSQTKEIDTIVSLVRQRISRQICENYINQDGKLYMLNIEGEEGIAVANHSGNNTLTMDYNWQTNFVKRLRAEKESARAISIDPILVVSRPELRSALSKMLEVFEVGTPVISVYELPAKLDNKIIGSIKN